MFKEIWRLLRAGIDAYIHDEALTRGAAIAFYIVTAIAPLLYICVTVAGLVMGRAEARDAVGAVLGRMMSPQSVAIFEGAIRAAPGASTGIVGGIIGIATLILTASGVFGEMEDALNADLARPAQGRSAAAPAARTRAQPGAGDGAGRAAGGLDADHGRARRTQAHHRDRDAGDGISRCRR